MMKVNKAKRVLNIFEIIISLIVSICGVVSNMIMAFSFILWILGDINAIYVEYCLLTIIAGILGIVSAYSTICIIMAVVSESKIKKLQLKIKSQIGLGFVVTIVKYLQRFIFSIAPSIISVFAKRPVRE